MIEALAQQFVQIAAVGDARHRVALGFLLRGGGDQGNADRHGPHAAGGADAAPVTWTCSMHPQFQLPEPGECPICFMDLIPLEEDDEAGLGPRDLVLSEAAAALAEIATAPVERRFAVSELTLVGKVTADEHAQARAERHRFRVDHGYRMQGMQSAPNFDRMDRDGSGAIDRDELSQWQAQRMQQRHARRLAPVSE